jgi:hypothetical protein
VVYRTKRLECVLCMTSNILCLCIRFSLTRVLSMSSHTVRHVFKMETSSCKAPPWWCVEVMALSHPWSLSVSQGLCHLLTYDRPLFSSTLYKSTNTDISHFSRSPSLDRLWAHHASTPSRDDMSGGRDQTAGS